MKTTRMIYADDLRNTCIKEMWYTRGNNEEYSNLLGKCNSFLSDELLEEISLDIYNHSDWSDYSGYSDEELQIHIAFVIVNQTARYFVEWEG